MGMYTEVFFRGEIDDYAYTVLCQVNDWAHDPGPILAPDDHELWTLDRVQALFNGQSAYHPVGSGLEVWQERYGSGLDRYAALRTSFKNYEGEAESFFDWVAPHVKFNGFMGYTLFEIDEIPVLWVRRDGEAQRVKAKEGRGIEYW